MGRRSPCLFHLLMLACQSMSLAQYLALFHLMQRLLRRADADGDGAIDETEAEAMARDTDRGRGRSPRGTGRGWGRDAAGDRP